MLKSPLCFKNRCIYNLDGHCMHCAFLPKPDFLVVGDCEYFTTVFAFLKRQWLLFFGNLRSP
jgi:hypothetical protein